MTLIYDCPICGEEYEAEEPMAVCTACAKKQADIEARECLAEDDSEANRKENK